MTFYTNHDDIKYWLLLYQIKNYSILDNGYVNVHETVDLSKRKLESLPVQFNHIEGNFNISHNLLSTPEGLPLSTVGRLILSYNQFSDLTGFDNIKTAYLNLSHNQLTSLKGLNTSQTFFTILDVCANRLKNLIGCPIVPSLIASSNELESLEGCPTYFERDFRINHNQLRSLKFAPKCVMGGFDCRNNYLKNLQFGPEKVGGFYFFGNNPINSLHYYPQEASKLYFELDHHRNWEHEPFYSELFGINSDSTTDNLYYEISHEKLSKLLLYRQLEKDLYMRKNKKKRKI